MESNINILLVDDHLVVRKGIEIMLSQKVKNAFLFSAEDYDQALEILNKTKIDLILLDININGVENINILKEIKAIQNQVKILSFSSHEANQYALRYIQNGADGYLNKFCTEDEFIDAIKMILSKGYYYTDDIYEKLNQKKKKLVSKKPIESLSNREFEIAQLLSKGYGNLEISNKLDLKMSTVSTYKNRIFEKLSIMNVVALSDILKDENN